MRAKSELIIALDPGKQKTGVALGNFITRTARPLVTITGNFQFQIKQISTVIDKWQPELLLVGLPEAKVAKSSHAYARRLADKLGSVNSLKVEYADEAYTTQATKHMNTGYGIDAEAACLLATDWLVHYSLPIEDK